ncbi:MAG TPA: hypothetical protein VN457_04505, partial [Chlamydiales bacterium]|nr:hypothetical protein [Chlamydiales bacterium]
MHDAFIKKFGGLHGLRDPNLLDSAVEAPKATMFGEVCIQAFMIKQQLTFIISYGIILSLTQIK